MESPFRPLPLHSRESTGNHRALAASSTVTGLSHPVPPQQQSRRTRPAAFLGPEALRKLDRFATATSASESESSSHRKHTQAAGGRNDMMRRSTKDSCEPTYVYGGGAPDIRNRQMPSSPSPAPTGRHVHPAYQPNGKTALAAFADQLKDGLRAAAGHDYKDSMQAQTSKSNHDSSGDTLVDEPINGKQPHHNPAGYPGVNAGGYTKILPVRSKDSGALPKGQLLLPTGVEMDKPAQRTAALFLPDDVTGLTDALESPQKTRYGVRHATLDPAIGHLNIDERRSKIAELQAFIAGIEEELNTTKDRLDGVESREEELRGDVRKLRDEWRNDTPRQHQQPQQAGTTVNDAFTAKLISMSEHIAALHDEFDGYRAAFDEIRQARRQTQHDDQDTAIQHHHRHSHKGSHQSTHQSRPSFAHQDADDADINHGAEFSEEEMEEEFSPEYLELKADIRRVEQQLSQVRVIVERGNGNRADMQAACDASNGNDATQASSKRRSSRRVRMASTVPESSSRHEPPFGRRRTRETASSTPPASAEPRSDEIDEETVVLDYDLRSSTMPGLSSRGRGTSSRRTRVEDGSGQEEQHSSKPASSSQHAAAEKEFQDELTLADARVNRTLRSVMKGKRGDQDSAAKKSGPVDAGSLDLSHDAAHCTVCASTEERHSRRSGRRARVLASVRRHGEEVEEEVILSILTSTDPGSLQSLIKQHSSSSNLASLLARMLKQHMDEFYHARVLYSELADELKTMDPLSKEWSEAKRKILVEHVLERVEELEVRAERIQVLKSVLDSTSTTVGSEQSKRTRASNPTRAPTSTGTSVTLGRALANSPPLPEGVAVDERRRRAVK